MALWYCCAKRVKFPDFRASGANDAKIMIVLQKIFTVKGWKKEIYFLCKTPKSEGTLLLFLMYF